VAGRVSGGLLRRALSRGSILFAAGAALLGNLIDYGLGEHRETGVLSAEFAVSTVVDFGLSIATGLGSAALVAGTAALMGATLPLWGAVALTGIASLGIGLLLDSAGVADVAQEGILSTFRGGGPEG
jgi:hypothetical protein